MLNHVRPRVGLFFTTITMTNRLTINIFAGSLLICLSGIAFWLCGIWSVGVLICILIPLFLYELANTCLQVLIFLLLTDVYTMQ